MDDAKDTLLALIQAAGHGEPTTIMNEGQPAAVIVSVADAARLYGDDDKSFARHLLAFPGGIDLDRDRTPVRDVDL